MQCVFPDASDLMRSLLHAELRALMPELVLGPAGPATEGMLLLGTHLDAAALDRLPRLRCIVCLSTDPASWIDLNATTARGIVVHGVHGYGSRSVAEHAMALVLMALRKVALMDRRLRCGQWRPVTGGELHRKRLGIVGLGGTGQALAEMGVSLGCEVVAWNRTPRDLHQVRMLSLSTLMATADIISLHLRLTDETCGIIDAHQLGLMKRGAVLVNTARGGLLDEAALVARLTAGEISAGLDVFADEPLPPTHPLLSLDSVTLTPHAAWNTHEAAHRLLRDGLLTLQAATTAGGPGRSSSHQAESTPRQGDRGSE